MKVLVTGAGGMLGRALARHCLMQGDRVAGYDRGSLDITVQAAIKKILEDERPDVLINCAAWTDVDGCERDAARAFDVNARGPQHLAVACREVGAALITVSTDYVFDGEKEGFYTQGDEPRPLSVYGRAKLEGERLAQAACARTTVVRSGWIFGAGGRNFLSRVVDLARGGERLKAIRDAYGTPTSAVDLAARLRQLALIDLPGIYHVVNNGDGASYEEFAQVALKAARCDLSLIDSVSFETLKRLAPRPRNSRLRCLRSEAAGLPPLPNWREAVKQWSVVSSQ